MLPSFARQEITVRRAALVDDRGTKRHDWANATEHKVQGCYVKLGSTSIDLTEAREGNVSQAAVAYLPPNADVKEGDRIVYAGAVFVIDGAPLPMLSPTGRLNHTKANLKTWRG